jgi:glucose-6-phosphate isomerase
VVLGIGGYYLAQSVIVSADLLAKIARREILFAATTCTGLVFNSLIAISRHELGIVVISKSGTTTEPAIDFGFSDGPWRGRRSPASHQTIFAITTATGSPSEFGG